MRLLISAVMLLGLTNSGHAAGPSLDQYLHKAEYLQGEVAFLDYLQKNPKDDQARFGLGILQFFRAFNRLGQASYEYGAIVSPDKMFPIPIPKNPNPTPISYFTFRLVIEQFIRDLEIADATLAQIEDEKLKLPVQLAFIQFDFSGNGGKVMNLRSIALAVTGREPVLRRQNPGFLVKFDRGDVAWLRSYCHLFMGISHFLQTTNFEANFNTWVMHVFPTAILRELPQALSSPIDVLSISWINLEPSRMRKVHGHLLMVCKLNQEAWKYIRSEVDNDLEWLPNAKQEGVIGLPVTEAMIDLWLEIVITAEKMLAGEYVFWPFKDGVLEGCDIKKFMMDGAPGEVSGNLLVLAYRSKGKNAFPILLNIADQLEGLLKTNMVKGEDRVNYQLKHFFWFI
jgi:hypothetical protein